MIYRNICRLAKKEGLSINKLEQEAGLSSGSICQWEVLKKVVGVFVLTLAIRN